MFLIRPTCGESLKLKLKVLTVVSYVAFHHSAKYFTAVLNSLWYVSVSDCFLIRFRCFNLLLLLLFCFIYQSGQCHLFSYKWYNFWLLLPGRVILVNCFSSGKLRYFVDIYGSMVEFSQHIKSSHTMTSLTYLCSY